MDGPDASRRHHESDDPFLLTLTEEERLHGLDLFGDDPPQKEPQQTESRRYTSACPLTSARIAPSGSKLERATPPVPPKCGEHHQSSPRRGCSPIWYAPLLAAVLTAVVVVYAVMTVRVMRPTADGRSRL